VGADLFGGEEAGGRVEKSAVQVLSNLVADGVGFCVGFEAVEGFGQV
jgi:hypothetical protein